MPPHETLVVRLAPVAMASGLTGTKALAGVVSAAAMPRARRAAAAVA